jgi:hypothetical protein
VSCYSSSPLGIECKGLAPRQDTIHAYQPPSPMAFIFSLDASHNICGGGEVRCHLQR